MLIITEFVDVEGMQGISAFPSTCEYSAILFTRNDNQIQGILVLVLCCNSSHIFVQKKGVDKVVVFVSGAPSTPSRCVSLIFNKKMVFGNGR